MGEEKSSDCKCTVCKFCNASENERPIFSAKFKGETLCVCARCLPSLIHG